MTQTTLPLHPAEQHTADLIGLIKDAMTGRGGPAFLLVARQLLAVAEEQYATVDRQAVEGRIDHLEREVVPLLIIAAAHNNNGAGSWCSPTSWSSISAQMTAVTEAFRDLREEIK